MFRTIEKRVETTCSDCDSGAFANDRDHLKALLEKGGWLRQMLDLWMCPVCCAAAKAELDELDPEDASVTREAVERQADLLHE